MRKLINGWEDLVGLESKDYYLDIELENGCGHIVPKVQTEDNWLHPYLSTHTFYGLDYKRNTILLQEHGFNVQLKNWDGETEFVDYMEQWLHNGKCEFCRRKDYCNKKCKASLKYDEWKKRWQIKVEI